ncbi:hypothetical protein [Planktotalea sp.]|uniref:hypothetical protein n=1 Tax=Planktotalea sp. TaxID=2029877 RepID=UPI0032995B78
MFQRLTAHMPSANAPKDNLTHAFNNVSRGIGFIALALPLGCLLAGLIRFIPPSDIQDSISHFYYTPIMGDFFVGCLFFNGILLMFMFHTNGRPVSGWKRLSAWESILMRLTGFAAIMIALFPTSGKSDSYGETELLRVFVQGEKGSALFQIGDLSKLGGLSLHFVFAAFMFASLAYFTACVFTRDHTTELGTPESPATPNKLKRNRIYRVLGAAIAISIVAIGLGSTGTLISEKSWDAFNGTFIFEGVALVAFGLAWLIKGRFFKSLAD